MAVEIEGIKITDAVQAKALETQGFISNDELEVVLQSLDSGDLNLEEQAKNQDEQNKIPLWRKILEELEIIDVKL